MRPKSIILLLLALGCGLVASIGISQVMEARRNQPSAQGEMQPIFVAMTDINPSDRITPEVLRLEEWPKNKVPGGALSKLEDVEGKKCRGKIYAGEPILAAKLADPNEIQEASDQIPKGYRVVAVQVDAVSASGSLIRPGDRVDVLVYMSRNTSMGIKDTSTQTILQDISVFAVDTAFVGKNEKEESGTSAKTVSLLVTPNQAEKVTLASEMGHLRLILRSSEDDVQPASDGATVGELFGGADNANRDAEHNISRTKDPAASQELLDLLNAQKSEPAAPPSADAGPFRMVVMRGPDLDEVQFASDGSLPVDLLKENQTEPDSSPDVPPPPAAGDMPDAPADASGEGSGPQE